MAPAPKRDRSDRIDPEAVRRYECADCHHRLRATRRPMHCPDCGGELRALDARQDA
jgi:hypothetical protein